MTKKELEKELAIVRAKILYGNETTKEEAKDELFKEFDNFLKVSTFKALLTLFDDGEDIFACISYAKNISDIQEIRKKFSRMEPDRFAVHCIDAICDYVSSDEDYGRILNLLYESNICPNLVDIFLYDYGDDVYEKLFTTGSPDDSNFVYALFENSIKNITIRISGLIKFLQRSYLREDKYDYCSNTEDLERDFKTVLPYFLKANKNEIASPYLIFDTILAVCEKCIESPSICDILTQEGLLFNDDDEQIEISDEEIEEALSLTEEVYDSDDDE